MAADNAATTRGVPNRDLLLTQLQETGEIPWPMGWPLSWLLDLTDTLGLEPGEVMLMGTKVKVAQRV